MKKLGLLVMPLMAVSFLIGCKQPTPTPDPTVVHTLKYLYDNGTGKSFTEKYIDDEKTKEPTWTPTYGGYTFVGWYEEEGEGETGTKFTFGSTLTGKETTIHAHWSVAPTPKTTYHLTFKGTHCKMDGDDTYEEDIPIGATTQRKIYPDEGYALPVQGQGEELTIKGKGKSSITYENGNIIITKFSGDVEITADPSLKEYTVHFDAKDGKLDSKAHDDITVAHSTMFKNIDNYVNQKAAKSACLFKGWSLSPTDITTISEEYVFKGDENLYAVYTPTTTIAVKLSNDSLNCTLSTNDGQEVTPGGSVNIPIGVETTLTISPINNYLPVFSKNLEVIGATEYEFDQATKELTITVNSAGCEVTAKTLYLSKGELNKYSWEEISEISEAGGASAAFKAGDEKIVKVNDLDHRVRIIGFDQDVDKDGNNIGITFEFANLISDSEGYSLATQWNDANNEKTANHNYLDSSVRMALVGERQELGHILWAQIGATEWSNEPGGLYTDKSVLDMLPSSGDIEHPDLKEVLVAPKKTVKCYENGDWTDEPIINNNGEYDKLFLLSPEEMGNNATREGAYTFYQEKDDVKLKSLRIKKQFNGKDIMTSTPTIPSGSAGQEYQGDVYSYAGYNYSSDNTGGGISWLRSPNLDSNWYVWNVSTDGYFNYNGAVCSCAFAVAPAFCI